MGALRRPKIAPFTKSHDRSATPPFAAIVLANYGYTCAVTGQRFYSPRHVEADGAHIIGKDVRGTDDPRNGVALSRSAHWAFDRGIFTISDQYEVVVNPKVSAASVAEVRSRRNGPQKDLVANR